MLQYGYANFSESGYQLVSENPFLQDGDRVRQLGQLTHYVMNTSPAYRGQGQMTYTGLLTDLGYRGETPRYYFQAAGPSFVRGGSCAHGYVQLDEAAFFGAPFLRLLRARFRAPRSIQALPAAGSAAYFADLDFPETDDSLTPAPLDEALLAAVLAQLLQSGRVLLRLDCQGDEAPRYARRVLLGIYSCLPYAARKFCGFITNVPMSRVVCPESGDELPAAVKLILVDGDAQLPARLPGMAILDMQAPAPKTTSQPDQAAFLDFLIHGGERRARYFAMVSQALEAVDSRRSLSLQTYRDAFQMQELADQPVRMAALHQWANWLQRNQGVVAAGIRTQFLHLLAAKLTPEEAFACLTGPEGQASLPPLADFARLWQPARPDPAAQTASPAALLALLDAVLSPEGAAAVGQRLSSWYYEQAVAAVQAQMLPAGDAQGSLLPTPGAIALLERLSQKVKPAGGTAGKSRVALAAARALSKRLEEACVGLRDAYSRTLEAQRSQAAALLDGLTPVRCAALVQAYDRMVQPGAFPLCKERMDAGEDFARAFGSAVAGKFAALLARLPQPAAAADLPAFAADLAAFPGSGLDKSGVVQAQWEQLAPVRQVIRRYETDRQDRSVAGQLMLLYRTYEKEFAVLQPGLLEDLRRGLRDDLMRQPPCGMDELPALLKTLYELAPAEPQLVRHLSAVLWTVRTDAPAALAPLTGSVGQWGTLSAALHCPVMVYFADGGGQEMPVQEAWQWLQWVQDKYPADAAVPEAVLRCAKEQPARAVNETPTAGQLKRICAALAPGAQAAFDRCLLEKAVPADAGFARAVAVRLRRSGARGADLMQAAGPGWPEVLALVYRDPMAGPQGETLRQLQAGLQQTSSLLEAQIQAVQRRRDRRLARVRGAAAALVAVADAIPMLALWISGAATPALTLAVLAALVLQAVAAAALILLTRGFALKKAAGELRWYGVGLAPGLVLTLAGTVLAVLL